MIFAWIFVDLRSIQPRETSPPPHTVEYKAVMIVSLYGHANTRPIHDEQATPTRGWWKVEHPRAPEAPPGTRRAAELRLGAGASGAATSRIP